MRVNTSRCKKLSGNNSTGNFDYEYNDDSYYKPDCTTLIMKKFLPKNKYIEAILELEKFDIPDIIKIDELIPLYPTYNSDWSMIFANFGILRKECRDQIVKKFMFAEKTFNPLFANIKNYYENLSCGRTYEIFRHHNSSTDEKILGCSPGNFLNCLIPEVDPISMEEITEPVILGDWQVYDYSTILHFVEAKKIYEDAEFVSPIYLVKIPNFGLLRRKDRWEPISWQLKK
jgi:hypothetical protein